MSTYAPERVDLWCGGVGSLGEERNAAGGALGASDGGCVVNVLRCVSRVQSGPGGVLSGVMCSLAVLIYVYSVR